MLSQPSIQQRLAAARERDSQHRTARVAELVARAERWLRGSQLPLPAERPTLLSSDVSLNAIGKKPRSDASRSTVGPPYGLWKSAPLAWSELIRLKFWCTQRMALAHWTPQISCAGDTRGERRRRPQCVEAASV